MSTSLGASRLQITYTFAKPEKIGIRKLLIVNLQLCHMSSDHLLLLFVLCLLLNIIVIVCKYWLSTPSSCCV